MPVVSLEHRFDGPAHAPVVILLPALGAKWSMWEPQMPELTRRVRVLRANHRGHGASPAPPGDYGLGELTDDVLALLDACELERVSVVGASLGGMIALRLAIRAPDRIDRLALLSTTAVARPGEWWRERAAAVRASGVEAVVEEFTRHWFTPGFAEQRPDIVSRMAEEAAEADPSALAGCCAAIAGTDLRRRLLDVSAPTIVVSAAHDTAAPPAYGRRVAAGIPRARFEVVQGGAHLVNIERADRVNDLLMEHIVGRGHDRVAGLV